MNGPAVDGWQAARQANAPVQVAGRVVAGDTGLPLRRARVEVTTHARVVAPIFSDDDGRFAFVLPRPGGFTVRADKAGYAAGSLSSRAPGEPLRIVLARGAAISGRVFDANGVPAVNALVVVQGSSDADADVRLTSFTDDRGEYRIGGLAAGRYTAGARWPASSFVFVPPAPVVTIERAIPGTETARSITTVLAGGQPVAQAGGEIQLRPGDDVSGANVQLPREPTIDDMRADALARITRTAADRGEPPQLPATVCPFSGVVRGRAVTTTGEPLASVAVRLTSSPTIRTVANWTTDRAGVYTFRCLPPGDYTLEAASGSHRTSSGGRIYETTVSVGDGETLAVPDIVFGPAGAVGGLIADEHGEPMQGVVVRALQIVYTNGRTMAVPAGIERRTDDRGTYRLFGLPPGNYLLAASVDATAPRTASSTIGYAPLYFPGTTAIDAASPIRVDAGVDVPGLNMVFSPSRAVRITGTATDASGEPIAGSVFLSVSYRSGVPAPDPIVTPIGPGGAFLIPNVAPGDYVVHAVATPGPGRTAEYGSAYVTVADREPEPLVIRTSTGGTLEGRLTIEGRQPGDVMLHDFTLLAYPIAPDRTPLAGRGSGLVIQSDGSFYSVGLYGPRRLVLAKAPAGWYVKSVTVNGADVTDTGFELAGAATVAGAEIVLSTTGATLAGRVMDEREQPVAGAAIVVLPVRRTDRGLYSRYVKYAQAGTDGSFEITGLPPGEYWAAAVDALETGPAGDAWQNPALLDLLASRAEPVTLADAERSSIVLRPVRR